MSTSGPPSPVRARGGESLAQAGWLFAARPARPARRRRVRRDVRARPPDVRRRARALGTRGFRQVRSDSHRRGASGRDGRTGAPVRGALLGAALGLQIGVATLGFAPGKAPFLAKPLGPTGSSLTRDVITLDLGSPRTTHSCAGPRRHGSNGRTPTRPWWLHFGYRWQAWASDWYRGSRRFSGGAELDVGGVFVRIVLGWGVECPPATGHLLSTTARPAIVHATAEPVVEITQSVSAEGAAIRSDCQSSGRSPPTTTPTAMGPPDAGRRPTAPTGTGAVPDGPTCTPATTASSSGLPAFPGGSGRETSGTPDPCTPPGRALERSGIATRLGSAPLKKVGFDLGAVAGLLISGPARARREGGGRGPGTGLPRTPALPRSMGATRTIPLTVWTRRLSCSRSKAERLQRGFGPRGMGTAFGVITAATARTGGTSSIARSSVVRCSSPMRRPYQPSRASTPSAPEQVAAPERGPDLGNRQFVVKRGETAAGEGLPSASQSRGPPLSAQREANRATRVVANSTAAAEVFFCLERLTALAASNASDARGSRGSGRGPCGPIQIADDRSRRLAASTDAHGDAHVVATVRVLVGGVDANLQSFAGSRQGST